MTIKICPNTNVDLPQSDDWKIKPDEIAPLQCSEILYEYQFQVIMGFLDNME
jgi:hypothetical protein